MQAPFIPQFKNKTKKKTYQESREASRIIWLEPLILQRGNGGPERENSLKSVKQPGSSRFLLCPNSGLCCWATRLSPSHCSSTEKGPFLSIPPSFLAGQLGGPCECLSVQRHSVDRRLGYSKEERSNSGRSYL